MSSIGSRRAAAAAAAADIPAYQERRDAIRAAAGRVFHRQGFAATKLTDVAEEAGMDRASLYYYVGSKEQLFREVVSDAALANIVEAERIAETEAPARERLARLIASLMTSFERHFPYLYVLVQEDFQKLNHHADETDSEWMTVLRDWNDRYVNAVKSVVSQGLRSGELRSSLPPGIIANALIGMVDSSHMWFRPNGMMDAAEIGAGMADMLLDGLAGPRPT
jgi:TetR/AcrR family transcriptional regulator, cholesterol catabolism regulator